jgi:uncharacterized iron-regulated membrane protein
MIEKDAIANLWTFTGFAAVMMEWHSILTIILLVTGIILNVVRIRSTINKKED